MSGDPSYVFLCLSLSPDTNPNHHSKVSGQFHSTKGGAKESVGNVLGSTNLQQSGREERIAGEAELKAAKAEGYTQGTTDRIVGKKDSVVGSVTGDRSQQASGTSFLLGGDGVCVILR